MSRATAGDGGGRGTAAVAAAPLRGRADRGTSPPSPAVGGAARGTQPRVRHLRHLVNTCRSRPGARDHDQGSPAAFTYRAAVSLDTPSAPPSSMYVSPSGRAATASRTAACATSARRGVRVHRSASTRRHGRDDRRRCVRACTLPPWSGSGRRPQDHGASHHGPTRRARPTGDARPGPAALEVDHEHDREGGVGLEHRPQVGIHGLNGAAPRVNLRRPGRGVDHHQQRVTVAEPVGRP